MPKFIVYFGDYNNEYVKSKVINYAAMSRFAKNVWSGGNSVFYNEIENIVKMFEMTQQAYGEYSNGLITHFVISFNDKSSRRITCIEYDVWLISQIISNYMGLRFQNVFYIHKGSQNDSRNLHVHFVVNRVSYLDGKKLYVNRECFHEIVDYARENIPLLLENENYKYLFWDNYISFEKSDWME